MPPANFDVSLRVTQVAQVGKDGTLQVEITDRSMLLRPRNLALVLLIVLASALQYLYIPIRVAANPPFCMPMPASTRALSPRTSRLPRNASLIA